MSRFMCVVSVVLVFTSLSCQAEYSPSLSFLNYQAALSGNYERVEFIVGGQTVPTNKSLLMVPMTTPIFVGTGVLYADEMEGNMAVRRSLLVSVEKPGSNSFMTYPYNLTRPVANLRGKFDLNKVKDLLPFDFEYSHACDRVATPRHGPEAVFDVIWPFCTGSVMTPPIYSAVITCSNITVTMADATEVKSIPKEKITKLVLHKTQRIPLLRSMLGSQRFFKNPCI